MKTLPLTEQQLAAKVVSWLEADGATVFHEVMHPDGSGARADIVALDPSSRLHIVEAKRALSWELLHQADRWLRYAHRVSIAVPYAKPSDGRHMAERVCRLLGIGLISVKSLMPVDEMRMPAITVHVEPSTRDRINPSILESLRPEHREGYARAGESGGGHVTAFKLACKSIASYAVLHPGCSLRETLSSVEHPWSSVGAAAQKLQRLAADGVRLGFELREEDGVVRVYVSRDAETQNDLAFNRNSV